MKNLENQLPEYKSIVAELTRDNRALKNLIKKPLVRTSKKRGDRLFGWRRTYSHQYCLPRSGSIACIPIQEASTLKRRASTCIDLLNQVVDKNGCWGFGLCLTDLRNQGVPWNQMQAWRIHKETGLNLPGSIRKRIAKMPRVPLVEPYTVSFVHYVPHLVLQSVF